MVGLDFQQKETKKEGSEYSLFLYLYVTKKRRKYEKDFILNDVTTFGGTFTSK
jgi:hypothetical protein